MNEAQLTKKQSLEESTTCRLTFSTDASESSVIDNALEVAENFFKDQPVFVGYHRGRRKADLGIALIAESCIIFID